MPKIIWSDKFSVAHPEIDNQHQKWIEIFNTAHDRMMSNDVQTLSTVGIDAVNEMLDYAKMHFTYEQNYMQTIGYPALSEHIDLHNAFTMKLKRINDDYDNGIKQLNSEIIKIVENWLVHHILTEDQKFKNFTLST